MSLSELCKELWEAELSVLEGSRDEKDKEVAKTKAQARLAKLLRVTKTSEIAGELYSALKTVFLLFSCPLHKLTAVTASSLSTLETMVMLTATATQFHSHYPGAVARNVNVASGADMFAIVIAKAVEAGVNDDELPKLIDLLQCLAEEIMMKRWGFPAPYGASCIAMGLVCKAPLPLLRFLVDKVGDVNGQSELPCGCAPLSCAFQQERFELAALLIEHPSLDLSRRYECRCALVFALFGGIRDMKGDKGKWIDLLDSLLARFPEVIETLTVERVRMVREDAHGDKEHDDGGDDEDGNLTATGDLQTVLAKAIETKDARAVEAVMRHNPTIQYDCRKATTADGDVGDLRPTIYAVIDSGSFEIAMLMVEKYRIIDASWRTKYPKSTWDSLAKEIASLVIGNYTNTSSCKCYFPPSRPEGKEIADLLLSPAIGFNHSFWSGTNCVLSVLYAGAGHHASLSESKSLQVLT
jgi:hypothetical protein